jgi:putative hydrolase of the HAD superfamily
MPKHCGMKKYKCIFLDLDRTLWDFEANALEAFRELYDTYKLGRIFPDFDTFHETYRRLNRQLWEDYRHGKIEKEVLKYVRFHLTLKAFGKNDLELAKKLGQDYVDLSATKTQLFPDSHEVLSYLMERYKLYIITNGFQEVQLKKIRNSGLEEYFDGIITSEKAGVQKPHEEIFLYALRKAGVKASESIMVGDDMEGDILGARARGMDQVFFNPDKKPHQEQPTYEIASLGELMDLL